MQDELNAGMPPPPPPPTEATSGEKRAAEDSTAKHNDTTRQDPGAQQQRTDQVPPPGAAEGEREQLRRLAPRDSGERDPKIKRGTAEGPSAETEMINATREMLSRQEAKTDNTMNRFGCIIDNNTVMVQNVKDEVCLSIATGRMERQEQFIEMAKNYDRRFQQTFERLEILAEGMNTMGRQLEETRSAMSTDDVDSKIYEMDKRLENMNMKTAGTSRRSSATWTAA